MNIINIIAVIFVALILIAIIFVLVSINKRLKKTLENEKKKIISYNSMLSKVNSKNPTEKDLEKLNTLAREIFKEKDGMRYNLSYIELAEKYKKKKETLKADFCSQMSDLMYREDGVKSSEIKQVINTFSKILSEIKMPGM